MSATLPQGWQFIRNADGCIGIKAPPPKDGESRRTSACVYASTDRDLHELLSKFVDHLAAADAQPLCMCKDRPASECPGEWEPGCDLGANAKFARAIEPAEPPTAADIASGDYRRGYAAGVRAPHTYAVQDEAPAVAQPAQEPTTFDADAFMREHEWAKWSDCREMVENAYAAGQRAAAPPQPVPLTDGQIDTLWLHRLDIHDGQLMPQLRDLARATERAHGIGSKT